MKGWTKERETITDFVKKRDNYCCVDCGISGVRLCVHHLDNSQDYGNWEDANNDPKNLVSLCSFCHAKRHNMTKNNKPLADYRKEIIEAYNYGQTLESLGKKYNVSKQRIHILCKKWGVIMRKRGIKYHSVPSASLTTLINPFPRSEHSYQV